MALLLLLPLLLIAALTLLVLVEPVGFIHQLLLLLDHLTKLVEHLHHFAVHAFRHHLRSARLKIFQHLLHLRQQFAGGIPRSRPGEFLDPVQHLAQVLLIERLLVSVEGLHRLRVLPHLLRQRLHVLVQRFAQFLRQPGDFLIARAFFQRLAQGFLCISELALGRRQVPILDRQRKIPQKRQHGLELVIGFPRGSVRHRQSACPDSCAP